MLQAVREIGEDVKFAQRAVLPSKVSRGPLLLDSGGSTNWSYRPIADVRAKRNRCYAPIAASVQRFSAHRMHHRSDLPRAASLPALTIRRFPDLSSSRVFKAVI
jgi:hypothetical protein